MATEIVRRSQAGRLEVLGLLMMVAGWGWNGGTFTHPDLPLSTQVRVTAMHYLPCGLLIALGAVVLSGQSPSWARIGISVVAGLGVAALAIILPIGISNPDPNSFGPHNFADYVPVVLILTGVATWFAALLRRAVD